MVRYSYVLWNGKSAETALRDRIKRAGLEDAFDEILVPTEDVSEVKTEKKRVSTRRMYSDTYLLTYVNERRDLAFSQKYA